MWPVALNLTYTICGNRAFGPFLPPAHSIVSFRILCQLLVWSSFLVFDFVDLDSLSFFVSTICLPRYQTNSDFNYGHTQTIRCKLCLENGFLALVGHREIKMHGISDLATITYTKQSTEYESHLHSLHRFWTNTALAISVGAPQRFSECR